MIHVSFKKSLFSITETDLECDCSNIDFHHTAVKFGEEFVVKGMCPCYKQLVDVDPFFCSSENSYFSLIHTVCAFGHVEILKKLIDKGADVHSWTKVEEEEYFTPLLIALDHKQLQCALELLKAGAKPNVKDVDKNTPLYSISQNFILSGQDVLKKEIFDQAIENCKKHSTPSTALESRNPPLLLAVFKQNHYVIDRLLELTPIPVTFV